MGNKDIINLFTNDNNGVKTLKEGVRVCFLFDGDIKLGYCDKLINATKDLFEKSLINILMQEFKGISYDKLLEKEIEYGIDESDVIVDCIISNTIMPTVERFSGRNVVELFDILQYKDFLIFYNLMREFIPDNLSLASSKLAYKLIINRYLLAYLEIVSDNINPITTEPNIYCIRPLEEASLEYSKASAGQDLYTAFPITKGIYPWKTVSNIKSSLLTRFPQINYYDFGFRNEKMSDVELMTSCLLSNGHMQVMNLFHDNLYHKGESIKTPSILGKLGCAVNSAYLTMKYCDGNETLLESALYKEPEIVYFINPEIFIDTEVNCKISADFINKNRQFCHYLVRAVCMQINSLYFLGNDKEHYEKNLQYLLSILSIDTLMELCRSKVTKQLIPPNLALNTAKCAGFDEQVSKCLLSEQILKLVNNCIECEYKIEDVYSYVIETIEYGKELLEFCSSRYNCISSNDSIRINSIKAFFENNKCVDKYISLNLDTDIYNKFDASGLILASLHMQRSIIGYDELVSKNCSIEGLDAIQSTHESIKEILNEDNYPMYITGTRNANAEILNLKPTDNVEMISGDNGTRIKIFNKCSILCNISIGNDSVIMYQLSLNSSNKFIMAVIYDGGGNAAKLIKNGSFLYEDFINVI